MAEFAAIPLFSDSLLADTGHLSHAEFGLYLRLLILLWRSNNCRIPNDKKWIMRKFGATENEYDELLKPILNEFCQNDGNNITQKRLTKEFMHLRATREKNKENANIRWNKNKDVCERNAPNPTQPITEDKSSASVDFKKIIFNEGLRWLCKSTGRTEPTMRQMLGKWCRDYGDALVAGAIVKGQNFSPVDAISFIQGELKNGNTNRRAGAAVAKPDRVDEIYAAAQRAAASSSSAPRPEGKGNAGSDDCPELPGFEGLRKKPKRD